MTASQQKRGKKNRQLDPLLARAIERLRQHMSEEGISQPALADAAGLTQGHVSKLLGGKSPEASFYVIARLAQGAGVSLDALVAPVARVAEAAPASTPRLLSSKPPPSKTG